MLISLVIKRLRFFFTVIPKNTTITFTKDPAVVGGNVAVMCESNGLPEPSYTIFHNDTKIVSNKSTYAINNVQYSDAGTYKCIASNKLGNNPASKNLTVGKITLLTHFASPTLYHVRKHTWEKHGEKNYLIFRSCSMTYHQKLSAIFGWQKSFIQPTTTQLCTIITLQSTQNSDSRSQCRRYVCVVTSLARGHSMYIGASSNINRNILGKRQNKPAIFQDALLGVYIWSMFIYRCDELV